MTNSLESDKTAGDAPPSRARADLSPPKTDRPGGPGQAGGNIVGPGSVSPAADVGDPPEEDEATRARRQHLLSREKG